MLEVECCTQKCRFQGSVRGAVAAFGVLPIDGLIARDGRTGTILRSGYGFLADVRPVPIVVHAADAVHHQSVRRNGVLGRLVPFLRV